MRRITKKNTKPELQVRRFVSAMGYRYRLHDKTLPGTPDLSFRGRRRVIFVHGCFWHQHRGCPLARLPKSNLAYWLPKLRRNRVRDATDKRAIRRLGWDYMVVWECELARPRIVSKRLRLFLR